MPRYSIKQEPVLGTVGKTGKTPMYMRWIVRENGERIGEFETEQQAMRFRDRLSALSESKESEE
jgi:hypothetical protein